MFFEFILRPFSSLSLVSILLIFPLLYLVTWTIYARTLHPLSKVPGPFLASISRAWIVTNALRGDMNHVERSLHQRYGPIVRVAPDEVVCADPDAVKDVYRYQNAPAKTDFYLPWGIGPKKFSKRHDLFVEPDEKKHGDRRRIVNHLYTLGNVLKLEPLIDECSGVFMQQMGRLADTGDNVDIGEWLQWYTFDVIGQLFFGQMFGFMAKAEDHESWIESLDHLTPYLLAMSLVPVYARSLVGMTAIFSKAARRGLDSLDRIANATRSCVSRRVAHTATAGDGKHRPDLLQQMLDIVRDKGDKLDFNIGEVQADSWIALFAGSDTTAIVMRSVVYHLLKNPDTYRQVLAEVDRASNDGQISSPFVKYAESVKLPLLCATVKEAMRLHPSVGMSMPRLSPPGGMELANMYIPEGYRVGMNAAVVQYDQSVFGADANDFRPARWLEGETAKMDRHMLMFGAGTRTCIGKHIGLVQVHKLLPQMFLTFDMELVDPTKVWTTSNMFLHKQTGIAVKIKRRIRLSSG